MQVASLVLALDTGELPTPQSQGVAVSARHLVPCYATHLSTTSRYSLLMLLHRTPLQRRHQM